MRPRINRNYFSLKYLKVCEVVLVLIVSAFPVFASRTDNVVVRTNVSQQNREELALRLRTITGWSDLEFDYDGALSTGDAVARGGSKSARDLIARASAGNRVILFEDASFRKDVVFCRVVLGKLERAFVSDVYIVLIDFADFSHVMGDKRARASFDVGWAVLHEMEHVVGGSEDPEQDVPGDCETEINRMRQELGLPIRSSYFFSALPVKNDANLISRFVRMRFEEDDKKRYWLIWDADLVGGLTGVSEFTGSINQKQ